MENLHEILKKENYKKIKFKVTKITLATLNFKQQAILIINYQ